MIKAMLLQGEKESGELYTLQIENYGQAEYYYPITKDTSGIQTTTGEPLEYVYKRPSDFRWDVYGEDMSSQKRICNAFLINFEKFRLTGHGLYIYSAVKGSGKTMLACCLANDVIRRTGMRVKFTSITDYINKIFAHTPVEDLRNADFLVLDDFGAQSEKQDWVKEVCFSLIDKRYSQNLSTIITSNLPMEQCSSDDRITSRIEEMCIPVKMPEVSIRHQKAEEYRNKFLSEVLESAS